MKIAIIGSGISGLVSSYLLSPHHEVTLFEKDSRIGGHSHTQYIKEKGKTISVDNGFMVYNPQRYPNFVNLLRQLGVSSQETEMSFGVSIPDEIAYQGSFPQGIFAHKSNIWNIRFLKFLFGIIQFKKSAKKEMKKNMHNRETLGQFLARKHINNDVVRWFLFPMLSAIWSIEKVNKVSDFPAYGTFVFLDNHKLLDFSQPKWQTIIGGSIEYVSKIEAHIKKNGGKIYCNSRITKISRTYTKVDIAFNGKMQSFDYIIFATHADVTRQLLSDIHPEEKEALEKFSYSKNRVVLHKDKRFVPSHKKLLAAWNFIQKNDNAVFTYSMNILQHIPLSIPVFVTLNPKEKINKEMIYASEDYSHPVYNLQTLEGQSRIKKLQGKYRTFYVGAHLGYGFHEDGVVSAIEVTKKFHISPPWNK